MLVFIGKLSLSTLRLVPMCLHGFSHFSGCSHHYVLAKLATSSIKVKPRLYHAYWEILRSLFSRELWPVGWNNRLDNTWFNFLQNSYLPSRAGSSLFSLALPKVAIATTPNFLDARQFVTTMRLNNLIFYFFHETTWEFLAALYKIMTSPTGASLTHIFPARQLVFLATTSPGVPQTMQMWNNAIVVMAYFYPS